MDPSPSPLEAALTRQRGRGLLGPSPSESLMAHSRGFARAVGPDPGRALDLGSGAGIPGLVLAVECWSGTRLTLLDASQRRCTYLELEVAELALASRVKVLWGRAEARGREPDLRATFDVVVARSFAGAAVTAECAAPFLAPGGLLVIGDPPGGPRRWDPSGLGRLGMGAESPLETEEASYSRIRQVEPCPLEFPRRPGAARRRPLF